MKSARFRKLEYSDSELLDIACRSAFEADKEAAADRGLSFSLSINEFKKKILSNCFFCQIPPATPVTTKHKRISLDRKDLAADHSNRNTIPCCYLCFKARRKMSPKMIFRLLLIHARLGTLDAQDKID